ncbi:NUDIX hydrolase [Hymenobacter busanensis]|uniref:GDP-mannose pyrophosphatase n=1 Tax=Hymenobacter busanensis TaxID=2607656 RepID=A0A7L4ZVH6_9BACT|nr:NUDIX hydrolase [Hymenobacter busanensis]KAA9327451.1 NUDIX hydrolase [Hymenobacter busanensis]QHJ06212.1 NUDIX domain-containing protein [Hymenobacter busanensis]
MKITKVETVYDGFYKLRKLTLEHDGETLVRERFEPGQAVAALVFDTNKMEYVFVRQYRTGAEDEVLEIPAGMLDKKGEMPEAALRREIQEELGYDVDRLEHIVKMYPSPGGSAEQIDVYYAEVSRQTGAGGGAEGENENITIVRLGWDELLQTELRDAKTLLAVQWRRLQLA